MAFGSHDVDEPSQRLHADDIVGFQPAHVHQQATLALQCRSEPGTEDLGEAMIEWRPEDDDDAPPVGTDLDIVMKGFGNRHPRSLQDRRDAAVPPTSQVGDDAR